MSLSLSDDPQEFLREVLHKLGAFHEELDSLASKHQGMFSLKVASELLSMNTLLKDTITHIQEDFDKMNGGSDPVSFLLALHQLHCAFEDSSSVKFRSRILSMNPTQATQYDILATQQYPIFLSQLPALPSVQSVPIQLHISPTDPVVTVLVPIGTPASVFIAQQIKEKHLNMHPSRSIAKCLGLNEYIYGEKPLSDFQCVREALRARQDLRVEIISRQDLDPAYVDRILNIGKALLRDFFVRARRDIGSEDLVTADIDEDDDAFDFDIEAIQQQRHNAQQSVFGSSRLYLHANEDTDSDEEVFSKLQSKQLGNEGSISRSIPSHVQQHAAFMARDPSPQSRGTVGDDGQTITLRPLPTHFDDFKLEDDTERRQSKVLEIPEFLKSPIIASDDSESDDLRTPRATHNGSIFSPGNNPNTDRSSLNANIACPAEQARLSVLSIQQNRDSWNAIPTRQPSGSISITKPSMRNIMKPGISMISTTTSPQPENTPLKQCDSDEEEFLGSSKSSRRASQISASDSGPLPPPNPPPSFLSEGTSSTIPSPNPPANPSESKKGPPPLPPTLNSQVSAPPLLPATTSTITLSTASSSHQRTPSQSFLSQSREASESVISPYSTVPIAGSVTASGIVVPPPPPPKFAPRVNPSLQTTSITLPIQSIEATVQENKPKVMSVDLSLQVSAGEAQPSPTVSNSTPSSIRGSHKFFQSSQSTSKPPITVVSATGVSEPPSPRKKLQASSYATLRGQMSPLNNATPLPVETPTSTSSASTQANPNMFNRRGSVAFGPGSMGTLKFSNLASIPGLNADGTIDPVAAKKLLESMTGALFCPKLLTKNTQLSRSGSSSSASASSNLSLSSKPLVSAITSVTADADEDDDESLLFDYKQAHFMTHEATLPSLRLQINGVDGINYASCPRLAAQRPDGKPHNSFQKLYVATCLIHGDTIRPESVSATTEVENSSAPRWYETILPTSRPISYNSILREAKIAFILVARYKGSKAEKLAEETTNDDFYDVPIAWCTDQLFQENSEILSGVKHFEMWPLPDNSVSDDENIMAPLLGASSVITETTYEKNRVGPTIKIDEIMKKLDPIEKKKVKEKKQLATTKMNPTLIKGLDLQLQQYIFRGVNRPNYLLEQPCVLTVRFDSFTVPIMSPISLDTRNQPTIGVNPQLARQDWTNLSSGPEGRHRAFHVDLLCLEDALYTLTDEDKELLWQARERIREKPHMISKFLSVVDWSNTQQKYEALYIMRRWADFTSPAQLIAILDSYYPDYDVRRYAVERLERFSLGHIQLYLLQLTQCLKYEPYHHSPLASWLLKLSIQHPTQIGHYFYWNCFNEMQCDPPFSQRYALLLEAFLTFCPLATDQLKVQFTIVEECKRIAHAIQGKKSSSTDDELLAIYREMIESFNRDYLQRIPAGKFQIPLDPRWESTGLIAEKCKIMSSKMVPLWLVFNNVQQGANPHYAIFKAGDDLRQDMLTLQILRFMDELWLRAKLDLRLSPYNVIACGKTENGKGCGFIEVVLNSQTTANISRSYGGDSATGAFDDKTIWKFLQKHNPTPALLAKAQDNFTRSLAGYCVATYVLGIGDRHNGNIMIQSSGLLFHIDFGHFLGNFKSKMGINRERAKFVCTPEMMYVVCGGKNDFSMSNSGYALFVNLCYDAFQQLRDHAYELQTLFLLCVGAGMPECLSKSAVLYIRDQLHLSEKPAAAREIFAKELKKSVNSTSRQIDNFLHLVKHSTKA